MKSLNAASCRYFTPGDACRVALDAYRAAARHVEPPPGESFVVDGVPWCTATDFAEAFSGELQARLGLLALDRLGDFHACSVVWDLHRLAHDVEPVKMAPIISRRETEMCRVEAELSGQKMHDLPPGENAGHNQAERSAGNAS